MLPKEASASVVVHHVGSEAPILAVICTASMVRRVREHLDAADKLVHATLLTDRRQNEALDRLPKAFVVI